MKKIQQLLKALKNLIKLTNSENKHFRIEFQDICIKAKMLYDLSSISTSIIDTLDDLKIDWDLNKNSKDEMLEIYSNKNQHLNQEQIDLLISEITYCFKEYTIVCLKK